MGNENKLKIGEKKNSYGKIDNETKKPLLQEKQYKAIK